MKVCIAYESKFGNGKKCAERLRDVIDNKGHEAEAFSIREIKARSLPQADLYVFSSPTHIGKPPIRVRRFLRKVNIEHEGTKYALMATCLNPLDLKMRTLQIMDEFLGPKGMTKVSHDLKIKVAEMKGPLEDGYKQKLEEFASEILDRN